jgi:glyoxylate reductase
VPTVVLTRLIPHAGLSLLSGSLRVAGNLEDAPPSREDLLVAVKGADAILSTPAERVDAVLLDAAGASLRVVANMAVGFDNVDVAAATSRGVLVTNTPGVLTEATADLTWALLLACARRVTEGDRLVRAGGFGGWTPFLLLGLELSGKTLGIVGMGRIGRAVALRAGGFGMPVIYTRVSGPLPDGDVPAGGRWEWREKLPDLLREAHVVSIHVPLSSATRHLIGRDELALMRRDAILLNTSRGPVVDEEALVQALSSGGLWAAGLDVYEDEPRLSPGLVSLPNVTLLPHLGSATTETREKMARAAASNVLSVLHGHLPPGLVNPEVLARRPNSGYH